MMNEEILIAIGRLEGKVDSLLNMQRVQQEELRSHDERLRSLEHSRGAFLGAAALVGAASSTILTLLMKSMTHG